MIYTCLLSMSLTKRKSTQKGGFWDSAQLKFHRLFKNVLNIILFDQQLDNICTFVCNKL